MKVLMSNISLKFHGCVPKLLNFLSELELINNSTASQQQKYRRIAQSADFFIFFSFVVF
jgi:hypothetical protein